MTPVLACEGVSIERGSVLAVAELDLAVHDGETVALLGPSGSGKSTLMYGVGGLLDVAAGTVVLAGETVSAPGTTVPADRRAVGMVFQNYALWPHMTAAETVAYPIRRSGVARGEAHRRAIELLDKVGIAELAVRKPSELSGGQQQRVGLARALARDARVYLFDEPTAHLDSPLRMAVQEEIARRRGQTGAAALYATHDSEEALAIADRVAIMRAGRLIQIGSPRDVYERPIDGWAARLTGPITAVGVEVLRVDGVTAEVGVGSTRVTAEIGVRIPEGGAELLVRPEWVRLKGEAKGRVTDVWFRGPHTDYRIETEAGLLDARRAGAPVVRVGELVGWSLDRGWIPGEVASPP